jgi:superfamily II RNA helicase
MTKDEKLNVLVELTEKNWGDLAPEALAGVLSTLITEEQLDVLIASMKEEEMKGQNGR